MDVVLRPEPALEKPDISHCSSWGAERVAPGHSGSEGVYQFRLQENVARGKDPHLIREYDVMAGLLRRQGAEEAAGLAHSGDQEHHLGAFLAKHAATRKLSPDRAAAGEPMEGVHPAQGLAFNIF